MTVFDRSLLSPAPRKSAKAAERVIFDILGGLEREACERKRVLLTRLIC